MDEVEENWGVTMPRQLTTVEQVSEHSFHGDGYRIKVFAPTAKTTTTGTLLDPAAMSTRPLTVEERALVAGANAQLKPAHPLDPDAHPLRKAHTLKPNSWTESEFLLSIYDPTTDTYYMYEYHM